MGPENSTSTQPPQPTSPPPPPADASRAEWHAWRRQQRGYLRGQWYGWHGWGWPWFGRGWFWGGVLVVLGVWFLLSNLGLLTWLRGDIVWPVLLILLGVAMIAGRSRWWR